jgi:hypothetical protein
MRASITRRVLPSTFWISVTVIGRPVWVELAGPK